jgi:Skp family chaperone for outer membrane proteins
MNARFKFASAAMLAACAIASYAYASDGTPPAKKHPVHKTAVPKGPTVEEQIQSLRQDLEGQINGLKSDLAAKDAQLKQAQQAAADAQAAAAKAQAAADSEQQALTENKSAVDTLNTTVTDLKANSVSLATTLSDETGKIKKSLENPDVIHFKGITLSPTGSFIAAETVYRSRAMGADINTQFTGVPLDAADNAKISEWQGTGRQSRIALKAIGKLDNMTLTGYYEADWLGSGTASNNNQSNSYVLRQRTIWAQAALNSGWTFTGGQMWSLATETTQGLSNGTEILPATIDSQYNAGFVWARQYGFRVAKAFSKKFFVGLSAENAEQLTPAGSSLPTNLLIGQLGNSGGLYNAFNATITYNPAPDFILKTAFEPGWGHWELFGIGRFWRDRIYPNAPTNALNAYNWDTGSAGFGASMRGPLAEKKVTIGLKGLYGEGMGRYGSSNIADITLNPKGGIAPLRAFSSLATVEINPDPRLTVYFNAGVDYVYRRYYGKEGYGSPLTNMSGCNLELLPGSSTTPTTPGSCGNQNKDVQEGTVGYWYYIYSGPKGRLRQGIQYSHFRRDLWSGAGGATNPSNGAMGTDDEIYTSFRYYLP